MEVLTERRLSEWFYLSKKHKTKNVVKLGKCVAQNVQVWSKYSWNIITEMHVLMKTQGIEKFHLFLSAYLKLQPFS